MGFQGVQGVPGITGKPGVPVRASFPVLRSVSGGGGHLPKSDGGVPLEVSACPRPLTSLRGAFQGREASEQHIRELCGAMLSGECPPTPFPAQQPGVLGGPLRPSAAGGGSLPQDLIPGQAL